MEDSTQYNKLIIFDLDGVLIDSRTVHYIALNKALEAYGQTIGWEEHLARYDGLPTKKKLQMLTKEKGLSESFYDSIYILKQGYTIEAYKELKKNYNAITAVHHAKCVRGYKIACASNSIRETLCQALQSIGVYDYMDHIASNEDVKKPKPYPEMYWQCMQACNAVPRTTIILEDSHIGRTGALESGAHLLPIEDHTTLTLNLLIEAMDKMESVKKIPVSWRDPKLNVLIPMAGAGSRFAAAGYTFPKPLIEVHGMPMIQAVVRNLNIQANFIFIVQKEHYEKYNLKFVLGMIAPGCKIVQTDGMTEGAACTTLLAKEYFDNENPLLICNSDQIVEWNSNEVMYAFAADQIDAGILTFESNHPKWSYAELNSDGFVVKVAEKQVISNNATVGVYFWKRGRDYVAAAEKMIGNNDRVNGEFYVAPTFNYAIQDGLKIRVKQIPKMWGIGTPEDLNYFLDNYKGAL